jgi:hypothetical protein
MLGRPLSFSNGLVVPNDRQEYYAEDRDTYMHVMINGGGFFPDDGIGIEVITQGYDIDVEPLFDQYGQPMSQDTVVDVDAKGESDGDGDADGQDLGSFASTGDPKKKVGQMTTGYTGEEDQCL